MNNLIKTAVMEAETLAREAGKQEGEQAKAIEIARNLLDELDDATIAAKTGLSIEAIKLLR